MSKVPTPAEWARANSGKGEKVPLPLVWPYVVDPIRDIMEEMVADETVYVTYAQIVAYLRLRFPDKSLPEERQLRNWIPRYFAREAEVISERVRKAQGK